MFIMYNPFSLSGKIILVTGASSGIGQATAIECSRLGASVVITGRNKDRLEKTFSELDVSQGQNHQMLIADLTDDNSLEQFVKQFLQAFGEDHSKIYVQLLSFIFINFGDEISYLLHFKYK